LFNMFNKLFPLSITVFEIIKQRRSKWVQFPTCTFTN
jgi:hypothetical protein